MIYVPWAHSPIHAYDPLGLEVDQSSSTITLFYRCDQQMIDIVVLFVPWYLGKLSVHDVWLCEM